MGLSKYKSILKPKNFFSLKNIQSCFCMGSGKINSHSIKKGDYSYTSTYEQHIQMFIAVKILKMLSSIKF